ncbi:MAG: hypothetical protein QNJ97_27255 [Myxococcota bacterium]|nr:hypothetical protein [Myxococcota bacterium]
MKSGPKLLLDTNIFRGLAEGQYEEFREPLLELAKREQRVLWVCYISLLEISAHLNEREAHLFDNFRDTLDWMDKLCCNKGMVRKTESDILRAALVAGCPPLTVLKQYTHMNMFRRRLIKMESFEKLDISFRERHDSIKEELVNQRNNWVESNKNLATRIIEYHEKLVNRPPFQKFIAKYIDALVNMYRSVGEMIGTPRDAKDIRRDLREHLHFHAYLGWMSVRDRNSYNFKKNDTDAHDRWLLVYLADGYTLVTADDRLRSNVEHSGCPSPIRIVSIEEAIKLVE